MFVVRCLKGPLSIILEKGSITLSTGQKFDLDPFCSRKWLTSNKELRRFIALNFLMVVHDDQVGIPKPPAAKAIRGGVVIQPAPVNKQVVIPLSEDKPAIINLDDIEGGETLSFVPEPAVDVAKVVEEKIESPTVSIVSMPDPPELAALVSVDVSSVVEDVTAESKITMDELEKLSWVDLKKYATDIGISCRRKSKSLILAEIRAKKRAPNEGHRG